MTAAVSSNQTDNLEVLNARMKEKKAPGANTPGKMHSIIGGSGLAKTMQEEEFQEVVTELRHKYITIVKSLYWEYFEEG